MEVTLSLKSWEIVQHSETKLPVIRGKYSLWMGDREIAVQSFNDGYSGKDIPFSGDTVNAIMAAESVIKAELQKLLS